MIEVIASGDVILMMSDEARFRLDGYVSKAKLSNLGCREPARVTPETSPYC